MLHDMRFECNTPIARDRLCVGDHGASVNWAYDADLELAADNLRARAVEQGSALTLAITQ